MFYDHTWEKRREDVDKRSPDLRWWFHRVISPTDLDGALAFEIFRSQEFLVFAKAFKWEFCWGEYGWHNDAVRVDLGGYDHVRT